MLLSVGLLRYAAWFISLEILTVTDVDDAPGKTAAYCGTGCQAAFGTCNTPESSTPVFDEFECGPTHGNQKCKNSLCCSTNG